METVRLGPSLSIVAAALLVAGCGGTPPQDTPTPTAIHGPDARDELGGRVAAAKDRRYVAMYTYAVAGRPDRTLTVAVAIDGSWIVSIPAGALGGLADVAYAGRRDGLYQCALGPAPGTSGLRPDLPPVTPGCVRLSRLTAAIDPRVQHVFTDWIDPLVDPETALSVAKAAPLPDAGAGTCYSVESNSAALAPPVDPGVYCYDTGGMLTAARLKVGTLTLAGTPGAGPPAIALPAPVVPGNPLPLASPPPPPTPSATATTTPTP